MKLRLEKYTPISHAYLIRFLTNDENTSMLITTTHIPLQVPWAAADYSEATTS